MVFENTYLGKLERPGRAASLCPDGAANCCTCTYPIARVPRGLQSLIENVAPCATEDLFFQENSLI
jgi:hypothetical protein